MVESTMNTKITNVSIKNRDVLVVSWAWEVYREGPRRFYRDDDGKTQIDSEYRWVEENRRVELRLALEGRAVALPPSEEELEKALPIEVAVEVLDQLPSVWATEKARHEAAVEAQWQADQARFAEAAKKQAEVEAEKAAAAARLLEEEAQRVEEGYSPELALKVLRQHWAAASETFLDKSRGQKERRERENLLRKAYSKGLDIYEEWFLCEAVDERDNPNGYSTHPVLRALEGFFERSFRSGADRNW